MIKNIIIIKAAGGWEKKIFKQSWNLFCFSGWVIYATEQRPGRLLCEMFSSASSGHHSEQDEEICPSTTWNFLAAASKAELWEPSCKRLKKNLLGPSAEGWTDTLSRNFHIKITKVASGHARSHWRCSCGTQAPYSPLKLWGVFLFCCPLVGFLCNRQIKRVKSCKVFVSSTIPPQQERVKGVHTSQALCNIQGHFAVVMCPQRKKKQTTRVKWLRWSTKLENNLKCV